MSLQAAIAISILVATAGVLGFYAKRTLAAQMTALKNSQRELEDKLAALSRREESLSLIAENVPAMIVRFGRDEICRYVNGAYARFYGRPVEAVLGQTARQIVGEAAYAEAASSLKRVLSGEHVRQTVIRSNAAGEARTLALELVPDFGRDGLVEGWYALIRDVTEAERSSKALRHIIDGTARATGTAFFRALTLNLAQATGLRRAMVAEILPDRQHARAIAYWTGEDFRKGMVYLLANAPCQQVMDEGEACFPDRVAELFPKDLALAAQGVRSYYGIRLEANDRTTLGVLVVMDGAPIRKRAEVASLVSVFAARAAAELERIRAESELMRSSERFSKVFAASPIPITISSLAEGRAVDVNPAYEQTFGWQRKEVLGRTSLELRSWPDAGERERWVAHLVSNQRTRDFETILQTRSGEPLPVLISAEVIDLDGVPHVIAYIHDQTKHQVRHIAL